VSIVRVFFNPLSAKHKQEYPIEPGTQIIDFLVEHFPSGFDGVIKVYVGITEVAIEDLDRVVYEEEQVTILVMPSDPATGTLIASYALKFAIAFAVGYVIQLLFPPSTPKGLKSESESPVYSLNATRNASRLGDPISAHYGTVSFPPDYASAPYVWYSWDSNNMYVDEILCLGHGEFDIEDIFIGDTPISAIEPGSIQVWTFGPMDHLSRMGNITSTTYAQVQGTPAYWPIWENVFTSPEVEDFTFTNDRSEAITTTTAFSGVAYATAYNPVTKLVDRGRIDGMLTSSGFSEGDTITITGTNFNNGSFLIAAALVDPADNTKTTIYQIANPPQGFADEDPISGSFTKNSPDDNYTAGPYRAQKQGKQINGVAVDILFKNGLYRVDGSTGKRKETSVEIQVIYQEIDANGLPINTPITLNHTYTAKKRKTLRSSLYKDLPNGEYEVTVKRITPFPDDDRIFNDLTWAGLKGMMVPSTEEAYGEVTLLAVRMKATNGLGQAARERIRVTATRRLKTAINEISTNPVTVLTDIWTNTKYGLGRPVSELDQDTLFFLGVQWKDGPFFNGSFDQRGTGFEAMQNVISMVGGKIVQNGGLTSVAMDRKQTVRTALFSGGNIVKGSLELQYTFNTTSDYDGVQIEYRDAFTFQPAFVTYPEDSAAPDTFILFGCTDDTYAQQYARYLYNVRTGRRKQIKFTTELEGLLPRFGDRIGVAHPMPDWGQSGVIIRVVDATTFVVDKMLDWDGDRVMMLRGVTGVPSSTYTVTRGYADNVVVFPSVPDVPVNGPEGKEPTNYTFGIPGQIVRDFIMSKITPKGEKLIEIEGQNYSDDIYVGAPPHMSL